MNGEKPGHIKMRRARWTIDQEEIAWYAPRTDDQISIYPGYRKGAHMGAWRWFAIQFFAHQGSYHNILTERTTGWEPWCSPTLIDVWAQRRQVVVKVSSSNPFYMEFEHGKTFKFGFRPLINYSDRSEFVKREDWIVYNMQRYYMNFLKNTVRLGMYMPLEFPHVPWPERPALLAHYWNGGTDDDCPWPLEGDDVNGPVVTSYPYFVKDAIRSGLLDPWWWGTDFDTSDPDPRNWTDHAMDYLLRHPPASDEWDEGDIKLSRRAQPRAKRRKG